MVTPKQPATSKLRSSCNACTDAKIGCSKERPTCARCAKRNETCVYAPTRRAGRPALKKQKQQRQASISDETAASSQAGDATPPSAADGLTAEPWQDWSLPNQPDTLDLFRSPIPTDASLNAVWADRPQTTGIEDFGFSMPPTMPSFPLELNATRPPALFPEDPGTLDASLACFLNDDPMQTIGHIDGANTATSSICRDDIGAILATHGTQSDTSLESDLFSSSAPSLVGSSSSQSLSALSSDVASWFSSTHARLDGSTTFTRDGPPSEQRSPQNVLDGSSPSCGCISRGLGLLQQLIPPPPTTSPCSHRMEIDSPVVDMRFEEVISRNRTAFGTINNILACSCSNDPTLLFILALVIFEILGWYAACISTTGEKEVKQPFDDSSSSQLESVARLHIRPPTPTTMPDYDFDPKNQDRVVCQRVLSELCSLQRAVNALSQRLQELETTPRRPSLGSVTQGLLFNSFSFNGAAGSANLARSMESSLRQHLQSLSKAILTTLSDS